MSNNMKCNGCDAPLKTENLKRVAGMIYFQCAYCETLNPFEEPSPFNQTGQVVASQTNIRGNVTGVVLSGSYGGNVVVQGNGNAVIGPGVAAGPGGVAIGGNVVGGVWVNGKRVG